MEGFHRGIQHLKTDVKQKAERGRAALLLNIKDKMGILKTYQIKNITAAVMSFKLGKAKFRCSFDKGVLNVPVPKPATFSTDNPIVQLAIESSPLFGNKITLLSAVETRTADKGRNKNNLTGGEPSSIKSPDKPDKGECRKQTFDEITTIGDMINILRGMGVPAKKLKTETSIMMAADELGLEFPNVDRIRGNGNQE